MKLISAIRATAQSEILRQDLVRRLHVFRTIVMECENESSTFQILNMIPTLNEQLSRISATLSTLKMCFFAK